MKASDITPLDQGVYELEKGVSNQKLRNGRLAQLLLGGIQQAPSSQELVEGDGVL